MPILLLMPAVSVLSGELSQRLGISLPVQPEVSLWVGPLLLIGFFVGAAGEELGYLGYAIDPLQERWGTLAAGAAVGLVWGLWHVPALLQNDQALPYIAIGLLASIGVRILIVWIYNNNGGSVFAGNLFHVSALVGSSLVATSAVGPIVLVVVALVALLWGPRTLARFRYQVPRQSRTTRSTS